MNDESQCNMCAGQNITWSAPSPLWNKVMRGDDINNSELFGGIVCPICFAVLAQSQGIAFQWRLSAQDVRVELKTTTPSGRIWDDGEWLWV